MGNQNSIIFVQREMEDKLGPMVLTSYVKNAGYKAEIIVNPQKSISIIKKLNPTFIGICLLSPSVDWTLDASSFLKQQLPNVKILLGGPHPTFAPEIIEDQNIDIICRGEGEIALLDLLNKYDGSLESVKHIKGLWVKCSSQVYKNGLAPLLSEKELSDMPSADRTHYERYPILKNSLHKKSWTTRGCPLDCAFCFNKTYKDLYSDDPNKKAVRWRSVDSAIQELKQLKLVGWKSLEIVDDQFLLNKGWVSEFCDRYEKEINLPFTCNSTAQQLKPIIVKQLKKAGCKTVFFGIESGDETIRRKVYDKPVSDQQIYNAADALHTHGLPFLTFNMVGLPGETLEDIYSTIKINQVIKTPFPWCSIIQPFPGTPIEKYFEKMNANTMKEFGYNYFQKSTHHDKDSNEIYSNSQKLFSYLVKSNIDFDQFRKLVVSPAFNVDKLYSILFYWHYGKSIRERLGTSWYQLFLYWSYSHQFEIWTKKFS